MTTDKDRGDMTVRMPVLSVTYGSFSLRLEGFDEPFSTMRDVAEYFRAVMAEDRDFGQAPAAPRAQGMVGVAEGRGGTRSVTRSIFASSKAEQALLRAGDGTRLPRQHVSDATILFDEDEAASGSGASVLDETSREGASAIQPELHLPDAANPPGHPETGGADPFSEALDAPRADTLQPEATDPVSESETTLGPGRRGNLPAGTDEAAVSRLISRTDSALSETEAKRRHATFAQLKAAVAATRAEGGSRRTRHPGSHAAAEIARYRDDLELSVFTGTEGPARRRSQPTEPPQTEGAEQAAAAPDDRMTRDLQAPLILALEQRNGVDGSIARPRRIEPANVSMDALFDESETPAGPVHSESGFEHFLADAAPADLTDLIDAAAAYLTHIDGFEDFPRPQLVRLIAAHPEAKNRESVMRGIGVLLRENRLRRSRRGQFQLGSQSTFSDAARQFRDTR